MVESKTLYRKYRGRSFSEIVGQDHITKTLESSLKSGSISHAYLLTGPHGVGKTSVARILAHEVNDLPYDFESNHLDIIEIDAASNRRIDEIRDLREKVHTAPSSAKFKVYIIDEVHMLTKEAFNALLKTLEEPPSHVIFILATTEAHKLPATIISRTQQHNFKPISNEQIVEHLGNIAKKESISIEREALLLVAEQGNGSFRDSIGILDRVSSLGDRTITAEDVRTLLGQAPAELVRELKQALSDTPSAISGRLEQAYDHGVVPAIIASQLARLVREEFIAGDYQSQASVVLDLIDKLGEVSRSYDPKLKLETVLYRANLELADKPVVDVSRPDQPDRAEPQTAPAKEPKERKQAAPNNEEPTEPAPKASTPADGSYIDLDANSWQEIINLVKEQNNTLYAALRMAKPSVSESSLRLGFKFPFHQARVTASKNFSIVTDAASQVISQSIIVETIVDKSLEVLPPAYTHSNESSNVDKIMETFGGGEVVSL